MRKRQRNTSPTANKTEIAPGLVLLHFEDAAQPAFVERKGKPYVLFGEKNDYPQYLLYLYNNSAKHSAIINGKMDYICGKGWGYDKTAPDLAADKMIASINAAGETLDEVCEKIALDLELFNGAYLRIVWTRGGEIGSIYHEDFTNVRTNADNTEFYISDEWVKYDAKGDFKPNNNPEFKTFNAFDPGKRSGTQVLYIKRYHPGLNTYTLPTYRGSIVWIEVDIEIGNYHLNNVKGGFFANKLINMNNGVPTEEGQKKIEEMFKRKFAGVRAQKFILQFNQDEKKATTVTDMNIAESDKLFEQLNKTTQQEIFSGHRVTSPMLFGIKTEGQLGGRSELREASELFQNTYVNGRQQWLEKVFNMLASYRGVKVPLTIQRTEPIAFEWSEAVQEKAMTQEELRERLGLPPEKKQGANNDIINAISSLPPALADAVIARMTDAELRSLAGLVPQGATAQFSAADDERDAAVFAEYGAPRDAEHITRSRNIMFLSDDAERDYFASLTGLEGSVIDILIRDPLATAEVIAKALGANLDEVADALQTLEDEELIQVRRRQVRGDVEIERKPVKDARDRVSKLTPETRTVEIKYSYSGPKDDRNRPFCAKMLELDRLYSRRDIEQISARLGYSVWTRRGGWYTIPGSSPAVHRPYCRHSWQANVVVKRKA